MDETEPMSTLVLPTISFMSSLFFRYNIFYPIPKAHIFPWAAATPRISVPAQVTCSSLQLPPRSRVLFSSGQGDEALPKSSLATQTQPPMVRMSLMPHPACTSQYKHWIKVWGIELGERHTPQTLEENDDYQKKKKKKIKVVNEAMSVSYETYSTAQFIP
jgi:hypothetical protein